MKFLKSRQAIILTVVLLLQAGMYYGVAGRPEDAPEIAALASFPQTLGNFFAVKTVEIDEPSRELLRADDLIDRIYFSPSERGQVELFIAYFKTQRMGQSPHSPKNCLPGSGWEPISTDRPSIQVPDWPAPFVVNRYIVEKGEEKSVTLYWYQSHNRVIASEYAAKFWLVADAIRFHRSDTSLVRVSVPVRDGDVEAASTVAFHFVRQVFPSLLKVMPL